MTQNSNVRKEYRVHGRDNYIIDYLFSPKGFYEIWFRLFPPDPYGNDSTTHHLFDSGQLCIAAGREPRTLEKAQFIAHNWMDTYSKYVRSGKFE